MNSLDIVTFLLLSHLVSILCQDDVTVTIDTGDIRGSTHQTTDGAYTAFQGIPYATPPTSQHRFRSPQPPAAWQGVRDATAAAPICPQLFDVSASPVVTAMSEDCLYLDVWLPGNLSAPAQLPVMVFMHGGGFQIGGAAFYPGAALVTQGDPIVLVVMQYRLGLLGFTTSGGDGRIPAMLGMKDQVFALKWVQRNIGAFGGDRDRVTIFGESAGATGVVMHVASPMSAGLFHRAISESAVNTWRVASESAYTGNLEGVARGMGCGEDEDIVVCLQAVPWEQIVTSAHNNIVVVVDGEFLTDSIDVQFEQGHINDVDLIMGFNSDDGDIFLDLFLASGDPNATYDRTIIDTVLQLCLMSWLASTQELFPSNSVAAGPGNAATPIYRYGRELDPDTVQQFLSLLRGKYTAFGDAVLNTRGWADALRDSVFVGLAWLVAAHAQQQGARVRIYSFEHRSSHLPQPSPGEVPRYAPHGSELEYLFDYEPFFDQPSQLNAEERDLSRSMIQAWTSFAKDGSPSFLSMAGEEVTWPASTEDRPRYLLIDTHMAADSVRHLAMPWQPVADFWLAIDNMADFEEPNSDESSEEEFESGVLKLDSFQADLAVLLLSFAAFLLLVTSCGLLCSRSRRSKGVIS